MVAYKLLAARAGEHAYFFQHRSGGRHVLKTVLIVDGDLGFAFWLGHLLDAAGYLAMPAKSIPDAAKLVVQLNLAVDVLVINLAVPGSVDFIAASQRSNSDLRVVGVLNDSVEVANIPRVHTIHFKGTVLDEQAKVDWLQCVRGVLVRTGLAVG